MPPKKNAPPAGSDESADERDELTPKKKAPKAARKPSPKRNEIEDDPEEDLLTGEVPPRPHIFENNGDRKDRLMISSIIVNNFKSYYGKSVIGPFHKNFTAIVGPNGSGKSNVIDALLFVFGFRSNRIRSKKVSNLIHKSSKRECDSCSVTIQFQRIIDKANEHFIVVPNSLFTISRTGYKNNSSTYAINGSSCSFKEVEAKLRDAEIDLVHNRFLILQGEVEAISMMKPKGLTPNEEGMLEYLEDIIGCNRLAPIQKLETRLERLTMELSRQKLLRDNAYAAKVNIQGDVTTAVEFLRTENEIIEIKCALDQRRRHIYRKQLGPLQEEMEAKKAEMKEIGEKLDANKEGSKETDKMDKELQKEKTRTEAELDKLQQKIEDLMTEKKKWAQNAKRLTADVEKMEAEKSKEAKKREALVEAPAKAQKKIQKLKEDSETLVEIEKSANEEADKNLAIFDQRAQEFQEEKTAAEKTFAESNAAFNTIKGKAMVAQAELADLKKIADKGKNTLAGLETKLRESELKLESENEELRTIEEKLPQDERILREATEKAPAARADEQKLDRNVREIREKIRMIESERQRKVTGNRTLEALMRERDEGRLPGFFGRLGDLGAIDAKYDAAISSNCGNLNHFVCDSADTTIKCINFLSKNRLPRSNFIAVNEVGVRKERMNADPKSFPAPRLFDLVRCEEHVRAAFYFSLNDMLVVDNLGEAQRIDKSHNHRFIIVTLNGDRLSNDGAITGGGQPRRGLIGTDIKVRKSTGNEAESLRVLKEELDEKTAQYAKAADECQRIDRILFEKRQTVETMKNRLTHLRLSVEEGVRIIGTLRKTIETQEKEAMKVQVDEKEIDEKQKIVDVLVKERDEAAEKANEAKKKVDEITTKLDAIFNELVERHKREAKEANEKRLGIEKSIAKETGAINNSERNIAKCDERIAQLEKDIEKRRNELERLEHDTIDEEQLNEKKEKLKELEKAVKGFDERFKQFRDDKMKFGKEELELEQKLKDASERVSQLKYTIHEKKKHIEEITATIGKYRLNYVPKFDFLVNKQKPEDMKLVIDEEAEFNRFLEMDNIELEHVTRRMVKTVADQAYAMEYEMRNEALNQPEKIDKGVPEAVKVLGDAELDEMDEARVDELRFRRKTLEKSFEALKGKVDLLVIDEYIERVYHRDLIFQALRFNAETLKLKEATKVFNAHRARLLLFKRIRLEEFSEGFSIISTSVKEIYQKLTDGGDSRMVEKSGADPFSEGIQFMVRPKNKSWKNIENLSGGEKTLASLSLVFALHVYRPTPFYVMDEIDAALDYVNVSIIAQHIKDHRDAAQFIIISLRNNMFEQAARLIGIYKVDDCTSNASIDTAVAEVMSKRMAAMLHQSFITTREEVTAEFRRQRALQQSENALNEKHYENFPSTSDIEKAEKIIDIETKVRKAVSRQEHHQSDARPTTAQSDNRSASAMSKTRSDTICKIFEDFLSRKTPAPPQNLTYDVNQLYEFLDHLTDISVMVFNRETAQYVPGNRTWIKQQLFDMLRSRCSVPADDCVV
ncbi:unnamed protein product [Caenorhabditis bovis]|uniref:SMC hinge domain-containing protein n=1 Tax=Caenorhabditis bovis TaxID=2654633 RepID=A0A8S1EKY9_9PELO|nr:unnamed protein product [Caenorhabditis bovis]